MASKTKQQEAEDRAKWQANNARLSLIIKPLSTARYECDADWSYVNKHLAGWEQDYGGLELNPDFQRGHVWTKDQQINFIENCLRGVVSSSGFLLQFNCPNWDDEKPSDLPKGFQCIDGLQRLTAVQEFLKGNVRPFGLTPEDLLFSSFSIKSNFRFRLAVHTFRDKVQLLDHYLAINTGGTPHSKEEIDRVTKLRESCK